MSDISNNSFITNRFQNINPIGEDIKLARLRRKLSKEPMAERAGISRSTLFLIEKGTPSMAMGTYLKVLFVIGLEK